MTAAEGMPEVGMSTSTRVDHVPIDGPSTVIIIIIIIIII